MEIYLLDQAKDSLVPQEELHWTIIVEPLIDSSLRSRNE